MAYKRISPQPVSEGGTGHTTLTTHNILIGNGTGALGVVAPASVQGIPVVSVNATSNPVFNTASVPGGGTGMTSATVVAPICGGNTTTSAFQSAASGISNAGYVLTSTGSATLPTWQASLNGIVTLDADTGSATGSTVDIAGGTGISTTATTGTLTVNLQVPIDVADGGTGETSLTAYAPICGGNTSTSAVQAASAGISNSGYVLTSNGSSSLPSFQAVSGSGGVVTTIYTNGSGTHTFNGSTKTVDLLVVAAAGGGGSGRQGDATIAAAGGGGSGNCGDLMQMVNIPIGNFGSTASYSVGVGGAGGVAQTSITTDGNAGTAGGNSTFGTITAWGGDGGLGGTTTDTGYPSDFPVFAIIGNIGVDIGVSVIGTNGTSGHGVTNDDYTILPTAGGGGSGANSSGGFSGGSGGNITDSRGNVIISGGIGGSTPGANGGNGTDMSSSSGGLFLGTGGGGGAGATLGTGGTGGNGGYPNGSGGGGGGSSNLSNSGAGGAGANGYIQVVEYL